MSGTGRKVKFHGAFAVKADAKRRERQVGGFVRRVKVRGMIRYVVMTGKKRR